MPYFKFIWDSRPDKNVDHLAEHGVSPDEAAYVVMNPHVVQPNRRHPGRLFAVGTTATGRRLGVSYILRDEASVYVITAFETE